VDAYDEASEVRRDEEYRAAVARTSGRRAANAGAILTGHLPAAVQERLGSELGILPARLTLVSLILPMLFVALAIQEHVRRVMTHEGPLPLWVILLAMYLLLESGVRLYLAMLQNRPCGSAAGWVVYTVFYLLSPSRRRLPPPLESSAPDRLRLDVTPDVVLQDAFTMREPLLTLLTPAEQRFFEERFGFNYRRSGPAVAVAILLFSTAGVVTSFMSLRGGGGLSPLLSLFAAGGVAAEQVVRLRALRRGPAGSVLGALVRPFTRKLMPRV
ncbi:MAG TPA: hypothetical protein VNA04_04525, partial [Thermoanaerobaculia bacterium]|nr:hypothetical protein [Thermoanaerobaculia bacterium]